MRVKTIDADWAWRPWRPSEKRPWDINAAAHLYRRAGFGASWDELQEAAGAGAEATIDRVCATDETPADAAPFDSLFRSVLAGGDPQGLAAAWIYRMLNSPAQLREKMTLFWHGHFATGAEKVQDAELMHQQYQLLRSHALGDFTQLLHGVSKDPAMLIYLDSATNRKAHPNENYAREVMELFCLGEGNYSEDDVLQLARCFTGWEIKRGKYRFNRYQHDFDQKTIFGKTGKFTGEQGVDLVLQHTSGPEFIAAKLVRFFVMDEPRPDRELVQPLAEQIRADGWNIGPTVRRILSSNLFFSEQAVAAKVRSPIEFTVGVLRCLEGSANANLVADTTRQLGQGLFYPPNVKGWDGGRDWINSSTLIGRVNAIQRILNDEKTRFDGGTLHELLAKHQAVDPADAVRWLSRLLVAPSLPAPLREELAEAVRQQPGDADDRSQRLLYLLCALPEFQLA